MPGLNDKIILITGAARRLGADMARRFHAEGARIAVHYRNSSRDADALVAELNTARNGTAAAFAADLIDPAQCTTLVADVVKRFGALDALVNNASTFYPTQVGEITPEHFDDLIGSNLKGPLFLSQAAAVPLTAAGGAIVNIVDIHASMPRAGYLVYCCAKAGLQMLTQGLALELGPAVRVNGIAPGPILWPEHAMEDGAKEQIVAATTLKRSGEAADISTAALYLLADATYVSGHILTVDGGRSLNW